MVYQRCRVKEVPATEITAITQSKGTETCRGTFSEKPKGFNVTGTEHGQLVLDK